MRHAEDAAADVLPAAAVGIPLANVRQVDLRIDALHLRALDQRRDAGIYLFAVTALGILLATWARTMPQFGLLAIPVFVVLYLLSGGVTLLEAMPEPLHMLMQASPATHFTSFTQAVLYRDAGLALAWQDLLAVAAIGGVFLGLALMRFRRTMAAAR